MYQCFDNSRKRKLQPSIICAFFAVALVLCFCEYAGAQDTTSPVVVSTYPANGETAVSGKLRTVSIRFSEPMGASVSFNYDGIEWGSHTFQWSGDRTTFYITRDATTSIPDGTLIQFTLSPPGVTNHFEDEAGNPLETYTYSFTIGPDVTAPAVVSTDPSQGSTTVSPDIDTVSVVFSEAMADRFNVLNSGSWGKSVMSGSPDRRILYMMRENAETPLSVGETISFTLNPEGSLGFEDLAGNALEPYTFSFTIGEGGDPPTVVSTSPAQGETNVSLDLEAVSITFSRPMKSGYSISSNFPGYSASWSADRQTITLTRKDLDTPLQSGITYSFTLNRGGSTSFRDLSDVPLQEYTFSFTTLFNYQLLKIPANPDQGFEWPYYLSVPHTLGNRTVLLVEPNNTGGTSDDPSVHDQAAENLVRWRSSFAVELDVPLLVPTFPRPFTQWWIYTHALDRDSLTTTVAGLQRIDLQLMAMINDAKARLSSMGYDVSEKVFINGFSASGSFANRFTLLHPEIIKAAASGSPGGWPTVPASTWDDNTLRYPVGISDLQALVGKPFDLQTFRTVPQYIYVGDIDDNDAVDFTDGFDPEDKELIDTLFGDGVPYIAERWPHAQEIFDSVQSSAQFVIYPGVGHTITQQMFDDLKLFFEKYHPGKVHISDAIKILQFMAGMDVQEMPVVADVKRDGKIGLPEVLYILQTLAYLR